MTDTTAPKQTVQERMRDAAVEQTQERHAEHRKVSDIVLGANRSRRRVGEIVKLGDDYVVEVEDRAEKFWTTVVSGEASSLWWEGQEEAVLHLIARRYDSDPNTNRQAAFFAARVLGIPQT